ncbi:pre-toxin TG domain-containing protein [bacterium]|nr:pre-toxin TG domain-containing protein [bacterium]
MQQNLNKLLAAGRTSNDEIALVRRTLEIMEAILRESPESIFLFEEFSSKPPYRAPGVDEWQRFCNQLALRELFPETTEPEIFRKKYDEYNAFGKQLLQNINKEYQSVTDKFIGRCYLYKENPQTPRIIAILASELMAWFNRHQKSSEFWALSAREGFHQMLGERPDLIALFRLSQQIPLDTEISEVPIERPVMVEAIEFAISIIPVVGNAVSAYEAYTGKDLLGYKLTDIERGILATGVVLPIAGRFVKASRAVYTESRMVALYGRDAAKWSQTIAAAGRANADGNVLRTLQEAESVVRAHKTLDKKLATAAAKALPAIVKSGGGVSTTVDQAVIDLWQNLSSKYPILRKLDGPAMQRVLEKGPNVDHLKGQLLEELIESRVVPWLNTRTGPLALGLSVPGKQLEYIPGHLIRDASSHQITDGIIGYHDKGVFQIVAIFEAKAGKYAARELSLASTSISSLSKLERAELRAFAKDVWRDGREVARLQGKAYNQTIEQIEREIIQTERGGQIRRDIERIYGDEASLTHIQIGTKDTVVRVSPTKTKFFGVLPKDVNCSLIKKELKESKFNFEIIGVDINQKDLKEAAAEMKPLAAAMTEAP